MPTTLSSLNPAIGEIKVRWQEPYVSEGLNAKMAGVVPRGTYRGFRLATSATALAVTITEDADELDHVAHYLTTGGHGLTIRRTGGSFATPALAISSTLVLAIYATYATSSTTTGEIRSYTLAEYNALSASARNELVVLGTVKTPSSGLIAADDITHLRRTFAATAVAQDVAQWMPLLTDPSFDLSSGGEILGCAWRQETYISVSMSDPSGLNQLVYTPPNNSFRSTYVRQVTHLPVCAGQVVRVKLDIKNLAISTSGSIALVLACDNIFGNSIAPGSTLADLSLSNTITTAAVDSSYRTIDVVAVMPATAAFLRTISLEGSIAYPAAAASFRIKYFQAWVESLGPLGHRTAWNRGAPALITSGIRFANGGDAGGAGSNATAQDPVLFYDGSTMRLQTAQSGATLQLPHYVRTVTGSGSVTGYDDVILLGGAPPYSITLPSPISGRSIRFIDKAGVCLPTAPVTIVRNGSEKIQYYNDSYLLQSKFVDRIFTADGADWEVR